MTGNLYHLKFNFALLLDSRLRGNDTIHIFCCRSNIILNGQFLYF